MPKTEPFFSQKFLKAYILKFSGSSNLMSVCDVTGSKKYQKSNRGRSG